WMAADSARMPPASASSVRSAEAVNSRPRSLVCRAVFWVFDLAMGCDAVAGARPAPRTGRITWIAARHDHPGAVNVPLTISVLTPLTSGAAPADARRAG